MVPHVDAVVAVTVMRALLFVLNVCMLRECEAVRVTTMLVWGMDEVWLWCAGHVCGTRSSGIVSSAADVIWMSVVRGMRGVGGVCEMFGLRWFWCGGGEWLVGWKVVCVMAV